MANWDLTALSTALEYDTANGIEPSILRWSDTRVIGFWAGTGDLYGRVQGFDVNASTGAVTAIGSALAVDGVTNDATEKQVIALDSTHVVIAWQDNTNTLVKAKICAVDGDGNITAAGATLTVASMTDFPSIALIDSTHFLIVGQGVDADGFASVCTVNGGTFAITQDGSALEFDTDNCVRPRLLQIDSTHFICVWHNATSGYKAQVLTVDTGTSAVTQEDTALVFFGAGGTSGFPLDICELDNNHFFVVFADAGNDGDSQVIEINTSTWVVTEVGTSFEFRVGNVFYVSVATFNSTHVVVAYDNDDSADPDLLTLAVDASWNISKPASALDVTGGGAAGGTVDGSICFLANQRFVFQWAATANDGFLQAFDVTEPTGPANIKTYNTNPIANIKSINTNLIANVKSLNTNA